MNDDIIIVGGGLAGLATAAYLARAHRRVTVFERAPEIGGRARTRHEGDYAFNLGGHAFYAGGEGMRVMRDLGVRPRGRAPRNDGSLAIVDGRIARFPTGMLSLFSTDLFSWSSKVEAGKLLSSLGRLDTKSIAGISVSEWLDENTTKQDVRAYVEAAVRVATYANASSLASAGRTIEQIKLATKPGVLYLDGGWGALARDLADVARKHGAEIRCGTSVASITHDGERTNGVTLANGEFVAASNVVVAGSPSLLCSLLQGASATACAYEKAALPLHAACLDLGLTSLPFPERAFALGIDSPLYFSVHSKTAKLAPDGASLVHLMKYLDPLVKNDPKADEAELSAAMDLLQPGWRDRLVHHAFLPSMLVTNALSAAANSGARPPTEFPELAGVHLVGDWIGAEGMLADASLASARAAAHAMIRRKNTAISSSRGTALARGVA